MSWLKAQAIIMTIAAIISTVSFDHGLFNPLLVGTLLSSMDFLFWSQCIAADPCSTI